MPKKKIDLRPHYAFAYCSESMEFGCKDMLYYSRKDKTLHILYEAGENGHIVSDAEDWERTIPIADEFARLLEKVFTLLIEAYHVFHENGETLWYVCDGSYSTVISGRRRVHYDGPCGQEPFESFDAMAYKLLSMKENSTKEEIQRFVELVKNVENQLDGFVNGNLRRCQKDRSLASNSDYL